MASDGPADRPSDLAVVLDRSGQTASEGPESDGSANQSKVRQTQESMKAVPRRLEENGGGLCQFFLSGKCRFGSRCRLSHSSPTSDDPEADQIDTESWRDGEMEEKLRKKKGKANRTLKLVDAEQQETAKKPRMRTADEVISRILWDSSVGAAGFVVGYVDRFLGVVERPFSEFNWEADPCDCDYTAELALPRHRIQYFTYRGRRVWDRSGRMDRVFGSTGHPLAPPFGGEEEVEVENEGTGIQDVEEELVNKHQESTEEQEAAVTVQGDREESTSAQPAENGRPGEREESESVCVHAPEGTAQRLTDGPRAGSTPRGQQEAGREPAPCEEEGRAEAADVVSLTERISLSQREGETGEEEDESTEGWSESWGGEEESLSTVNVSPPPASLEPRLEWRGGRPPKLRPTHFISFRANTPSILSSFQRLREELTALLPSSSALWVPPSSLHVTLCLLVLRGPAEVAAAGEILRRFAQLDRNPPVAVSFPPKLKHFSGRVLYLSPQPQIHLQQLNGGLQEAFRDRGLLHRDSYAPRYHLTLAKVPGRDAERPFEGAGDVRVGKGVNFGRLPVNTLHLCGMDMSKTEDGFYTTLSTVTLR